MRIIAASLLAAILTLSVGAADASAAAPTLRVVPGPSLIVSGGGFLPRTMVVLRLQGPDIKRVTRVRSGRNGRFLVRFALETCSLTAVTATGVRNRTARVPTAWFVRECPPPPPLAPGGNLG